MQPHGNISRGGHSRRGKVAYAVAEPVPAYKQRPVFFCKGVQKCVDGLTQRTGVQLLFQGVPRDRLGKLLQGQLVVAAAFLGGAGAQMLRAMFFPTLYI